MCYPAWRSPVLTLPSHTHSTPLRPPRCRLVEPDLPAALLHYAMAARAQDPSAQAILGYRHAEVCVWGGAGRLGWLEADAAKYVDAGTAAAWPTSPVCLSPTHTLTPPFTPHPAAGAGRSQELPHRRPLLRASR
jgi:hypothetical protein